MHTVVTARPRRALSLLLAAGLAGSLLGAVNASSAAADTAPPAAAPVLADQGAKKIGNANPLMDYQYGADPYAMVYGDRVYEYLTSDGSEIGPDGRVKQTYEKNTDGTIKDNSYGKIQSLTIISSADMVNWTNHGQVKVAGPSGAAPWANNSWAPSAAHRTVDGRERFFLYFANSAGGIGVLESGSPTGPFTDPIGKPLVSAATPGAQGVVWLFDPAVLVDTNGKAYLYFGGGVPSTDGTSTPEQTDHPRTSRVIELGADMISTIGSAATLDAPAVFEDSGINKIGDTYYYSYCTNFSHSPVIDGHPVSTGTIAYMTSKNPMGPFTWQGEILPNPGAFFGVGGNNHHALFQFKKQWYVTYHASTVQSALVAGGSLDAARGYRSTHIDKVTIDADGSIAPVTGTLAGVPQVRSLDPYRRTEGETIAWSSGIQDAYDPASGVRVQPSGPDLNGRQVLSNVDDGEWTSVARADFGSNGARTFSAAVVPRLGGTISVRLDSPDVRGNNVVGTLTVRPTADGRLQTLTTHLLRPVTGVHKVFFVYQGPARGHLFDVDAWAFDHSAVSTALS